MAEIATIARPYAEALFKAVGAQVADHAKLKDQIAALAALASDEGLRQFADSPKVDANQVFDLVAGVAQDDRGGVPREALLHGLQRLVEIARREAPARPVEDRVERPTAEDSV